MLLSQFEQLSDLITSDTISNDGKLDILEGVGYYWSLITDDIIRLNERLVAIWSKLGYILSGPVDSGDTQSNSHIANCVHIMKVATEPLMSIEENNSLSEKVERFWSLDAIGISPTEKSVYERTEQSIKFVDGRYQVELPFEEEFPIIEDITTTIVLNA